MAEEEIDLNIIYDEEEEEQTVKIEPEDVFTTPITPVSQISNSSSTTVNEDSKKRQNEEISDLSSPLKKQKENTLMEKWQDFLQQCSSMTAPLSLNIKSTVHEYLQKMQAHNFIKLHSEWIIKPDKTLNCSVTFEKNCPFSIWLEQEKGIHSRNWILDGNAPTKKEAESIAYQKWNLFFLSTLFESLVTEYKSQHSFTNEQSLSEYNSITTKIIDFCNRLGTSLMTVYGTVAIFGKFQQPYFKCTLSIKKFLEDRKEMLCIDAIGEASNKKIAKKKAMEELWKILSQQFSHLLEKYSSTNRNSSSSQHTLLHSQQMIKLTIQPFQQMIPPFLFEHSLSVADRDAMYKLILSQMKIGEVDSIVKYVMDKTQLNKRELSKLFCRDWNLQHAVSVVQSATIRNTLPGIFDSIENGFVIPCYDRSLQIVALTVIDRNSLVLRWLGDVPSTKEHETIPPHLNGELPLFQWLQHSLFSTVKLEEYTFVEKWSKTDNKFHNCLGICRGVLESLCVARNVGIPCIGCLDNFSTSPCSLLKIVEECQPTPSVILLFDDKKGETRQEFLNDMKRVIELLQSKYFLAVATFESKEMNLDITCRKRMILQSKEEFCKQNNLLENT